MARSYKYRAESPVGAGHARDFLGWRHTYFLLTKAGVLLILCGLATAAIARGQGPLLQVVSTGVQEAPAALTRFRYFCSHRGYGRRVIFTTKYR
jgi:hypothetical protein